MKKKKNEFSNWISGKHGWQIKSNFLGVKHGKSNRLKKREKMILLIKKVENRSIKKKVESYPKKKKWKTNVREKCGDGRKKVFFFF